MQTITMSAKGQIVIPLRIRKKFGLKKGEKLIIEAEDRNIKLIPRTVDITTLVGSVKPVLDRETVRKNIRKMRENWR